MSSDRRITRIKLYFCLGAAFVVASMAFFASAFRDAAPLYAIKARTEAVSFYHRLEYRRYAYGAPDLEWSAHENNVADTVPVLVYHGILDGRSSDGSNINIHTKLFREHMFALKAAGYSSIDSEDLYAWVQEKKPLPSRAVMITFDDGRADSFKNGDPVLGAVGYRAVMFAIAHLSLNTPGNFYLSKRHLLYMERSGRWDIQSHSYDGHRTVQTDDRGGVGNFFSHRKWLENERRNETLYEYIQRVSEDLRASRSAFEELMEKPIIAFAFPFDDYGQKDANFLRAEYVVPEVAQRHFPLLFYQNMPGSVFSANTIHSVKNERANNAYMIKRITVSPDMSADDLLRMLRNGATKALPYEDSFSNDNGWLQPWGLVSADNGMLRIAPRDKHSGAATVLDGSQLWEDYTVRATVSGAPEHNVFMWVRFQDEYNNAACNFSATGLRLEQMINGQKTILNEVHYGQIYAPGNALFTVGATVRDDIIRCFIHGESVEGSASLDPRLRLGGVGFKLWNDPDLDVELIIREIEIHSESVTPPL